MKKKPLLASFVVVIAGVMIISCDHQKVKNENAQIMSKDSLIKRGAYLVTISGCDDCHSPKKMGPMGPELDMERRLSGYPSNRPLPSFDSNLVKKGLVMLNQDLTAATGPWGISFAANLTSDPTGAGSWVEENFSRAMRKGKFKGLEGSRNLLPPMPWQNFAQMTDEDLKAIFTFLQSTKPVENIVPAARQFSDL